MREPPPPQLAALLAQLGLAAEQDFAGVDDNVHRIAGDLPRFESVWVDALRQARILTAFQAAEIHAGRGKALKVGRYIVCHSVQECCYGTVFRAEDRNAKEVVRLTVFPARNSDPKRIRSDFLPATPSSATNNSPNTIILEQLARLCTVAKRSPQYAGMIDACGAEDSRVWASSPWVDGTSLADWILHHGRLPPAVVLEIARAMLGELVVLEAVGVVHGDIRLENILVRKDGQVSLPHPGLRGVMRPEEGISYHDLGPESVAGLAPERVSQGTPPTFASDLFACGCVWWHLLCGRSPLGGGDTLARLRAAQAAAIDDLHQWAAEVPPILDTSIGECLQKDPQKRPKSFAELAARLGPLRWSGRQEIVRGLAAPARPRAPWLRSRPHRVKRQSHPHWLTAAAILLISAVAIVWPIWVARNRPHSGPRISHEEQVSQLNPRAGSIDVKAQATSPTEIARPKQHSQSPIVDPAVQPVGHFEEPAGDEIRLPSGTTIRSETLQLKPRQRVRALSGRARIVVPREGLMVAVEHASFENIDFVGEDRTDLTAVQDESFPILIRLMAAECDFRGCSFQSANGSRVMRIAILWQHSFTEPAAVRTENGPSRDMHSAIKPAAALDLPSGRIRMQDCVFRRVRTGIESCGGRAVGLELANCLHLGPGCLIRLAHFPAADEPVHIHLSQVTLREAESLLDCRGSDPDNRPGEIVIEASGCVLFPGPDAALLTVNSEAFPQRLLHEMKWTGQGSVVAGQVPFGRWAQPGGDVRTIDDSTITIAGLVRGEVEFAGRFDGNPAHSGVVSGEAPTQDAESAGADVRKLPPEIR